MKNLKKKSVCFTLILAMLLLLPAHAMAVDDQAETATEMSVTYDDITVFPDGGKDYKFYVEGVENHYLVPPEGFSPLTASDEDLARYGFPGRPDESDIDSFNEWKELMANYTGTPEPELSVTIYPTESETTTIQPRTSTRNSKIWSGYESNLGSSSTSFYTQVQMDYTQPTVTSTSGTCLNSYWVGLGGRNTGRLVQAGTATQGASLHYAWYEYLSDTGSTVSMQNANLAVSAGDNIHVYISFQAANNIFSYYIANNTTGKSAANTVTLNTATQFDGTTAEWIVERCSTMSGTPYNLGNYGTVTLKNCKATLNSSNTWYNLASLSNLYQVTMTSNGSSSGNVLSVPGSIASKNQFTCTWRGYN